MGISRKVAVRGDMKHGIRPQPYSAMLGITQHIRSSLNQINIKILERITI